MKEINAKHFFGYMSNELESCVEVYNSFYINYKNSYNAFKVYKTFVSNPDLYYGSNKINNKDLLAINECSSVPLIVKIRGFLHKHLEAVMVMREQGLMVALSDKISKHKLWIEEQFKKFSNGHKKMKKKMNQLKAYEHSVNEYIEVNTALNEEFILLKNKFFEGFLSFTKAFEESKSYFQIFDQKHLNKMSMFAEEFLELFSSLFRAPDMPDFQAKITNDCSVEKLQERFMKKLTIVDKKEAMFIIAKSE